MELIVSEMVDVVFVVVCMDPWVKLGTTGTAFAAVPRLLNNITNGI
jgi:hypothetical protein